MPTHSPWSPRPRRNPPGETGFDNWLHASLRASFGGVSQEAVPSDLLDLVRRSSGGDMGRA